MYLEIFIPKKEYRISFSKKLREGDASKLIQNIPFLSFSVRQTSPAPQTPNRSNPDLSNSKPRSPHLQSILRLRFLTHGVLGLNHPRMGLADAARSRLLATLRPWLAADPAELRVELGPVRSRAVARGLELGATALSAPDSFPARVDRAVVAEVELAVSPWGAPALAAVVRGVDVSLTLRYSLAPQLPRAIVAMD